MSTTTEPNSFHRAFEPVFRLLTQQQIDSLISLHADDALQDRLAYLSEKSSEGELTDTERSEYEGYVQANQIVAILQSEAKRFQGSL